MKKMAKLQRAKGYTDEQMQLAMKLSEENPETWLEENARCLILLVNGELGMRQGKISAQVGHAAIGAFKKAPSEQVDLWTSQQRPIKLFKVPAETMFSVKGQAQEIGVHTYTVRDAGRTQIEAGSQTVTSLGPDLLARLRPLTENLKPL